MGLKLPAVLDTDLLRGNSEEYFPQWIKKHRPDIADDGKHGGEYHEQEQHRTHSVKMSVARAKRIIVEATK